jgi:membrane associated rhomboid family serine protease
MRSASTIPAIGASGAISGVLGACFIGAPGAKAPLFFLFSMLFPIVYLIEFAGIAISHLFIVVAFVLSFTILILMIYALFDPRFRITWYALPFVAVWVIAQALLAAYAGLRTEVHYWAHVIGFLVGIGGWFLVRKKEPKEFRERPREEIPVIA